MDTDKTQAEKSGASPDDSDNAAGAETAASETPREFNGPKGPEPTRYGDWEQKGRCSDF